MKKPTIISQMIEEWENETSVPDYFKKIAGYLKEFQSMSKVEIYLSDDAEGYVEMDDYLSLLKGMAELCSHELSIEEIQGTDDGDTWSINFMVEGQKEEFQFNNPNSDWLDFEFIKLVNDKIKKYSSNGKFNLVFATSEMNTDQTFDMAFIDDDTFKLLLNHSPRYAFQW